MCLSKSHLFNFFLVYRIQGNAGKRILNKCPPAYSCGSHGGMWTNATLPTVVGETLQIPIYGSWSGNCDWYVLFYYWLFGSAYWFFGSSYWLFGSSYWLVKF